MLINRSLKLNVSTEECGDVFVSWHLHQTGLSFLEFSSSLDMFLDVVSEIFVKKFYSLSYAEQWHEGTKWKKGIEG